MEEERRKQIEAIYMKIVGFSFNVYIWSAVPDLTFVIICANASLMAESVEEYNLKATCLQPHHRYMTAPQVALELSLFMFAFVRNSIS